VGWLAQQDTGEAPEALLARAQGGDTAAFAALLRAHQASIYSLALRLLVVREDAQELAQDVFLLLHRHLSSISSAAHLRAWLYRAVCHRGIDRLRQRSGRTLLPLEAAELLEAPSSLADPWLE